MLSKSKFSQKNKEIFERTPSSIVEFINSWKNKAIESYKGLAINLKYDYALLKNELINESSDEYSFIQTEKQKELTKKLDTFLINASKEYGSFAYYVFHQEDKVDEYIQKIVENEAERKLVKFMNSVEKKAGKIIDGKGLYIGADLSINGYVVGEDKTVNVYSILAGGYNIQRLHFRVLVK